MMAWSLGLSEIVLLALLGGGFSLPLGLPPLPPDQDLIRTAPDKCLYYVSWAGTAAADPNSENQTERLLAEPEVQQFVKEVEQRLLEALNRNLPVDPNVRTVATTMPPLLKTLFMRPGAVYVSRFAVNFPAPDVQGALVVNVGNQAQAVRLAIGHLEQLVLSDLRAQFGEVQEVTIGGTRFRRWPLPAGVPQVAWGFSGDYIVIAVGDGTAQRIVERLNGAGDVPGWLRQLHERLPVDRPSIVTHVDVERILQIASPFITEPQISATIQAFGLSQVKSYSSITGLHGKGMVSRTLLAIEGEPKGFLATLVGKPLTAADLALVPRDANIAKILRLDSAELFSKGLEAAQQIDPQLGQTLAAQAAQLEGQLGVSLQKDLLGGLGDTWAVFHSPGTGGRLLTGLAGSASLRDRDRFIAAHDNILLGIRAQLESQSEPTVVVREFSYLDHEIYYLHWPRGGVPVAPAWTIGKDRVHVALYPQTIKALLARRTDDQSLAEVPAVAEHLATGPLALSYEDTGDLLQTLYSIAQAFGPIAVAELNRAGVPVDLTVLPSFPSIGRHAGPSIQLVRKTEDGLVSEHYSTIPLAEVGAVAPFAAGLLLGQARAMPHVQQEQTVNNLKHVALAMHNYANEHNSTLPAAASYDSEGKPLLSWRVHLLPYLEGEALYKQFHLDEPWDSEHNLRLLPQMPAVYANMDRGALKAAGKTTVLAASGKGSMFEGKEGKGFHEIHDGTSKTIMALDVQPELAVEWTKPADWEVDLERPLKGLGGPNNHFFAVLADGSVQTISNAITPEKMKALVTAAGREVVQLEQGPNGVH